MFQFDHRKYNEIENTVGFWKALLCFRDSQLKVTFTTGWQNLLCLSSVFLSHRNSTGVIVPSGKGFTPITEKENKKKPIDTVKSTRPLEFHFPSMTLCCNCGQQIVFGLSGKQSGHYCCCLIFFFLLAKVLKKKKGGKKKVDFFNKQLQWQMADECTTSSSNGTRLRGSRGTAHLPKGATVVAWEGEWESEFLTMVKMYWRKRTWWQGVRKGREWLRSIQLSLYPYGWIKMK